MERRVVITGMGAITPLALNAEGSWQAMLAGTCGIAPITAFDTTEYKVHLAAEVKGFDAAGLLGKADARRNDRNTQFALVASDQAMASSGLDREGAIDPERLGVYIGSGVGGIATTEEQVNRLSAGGARKVSPFFIPMMIANMAAGAVSIRHHALGPTLPVVTACATSTNTIGEAFRAIKHGYADAILAGGTEAAIVPVAIAGFTSCMALSKNPDPKTACRPFDANRDGFVMGEGAAVLALEELEHARARGANVIAEVSGYGNTADAYHITSPDPEAAGIARAIEQAVDEAGVDVAEGLYVNAHGTSTKLNDSSETLGLKRALGEDAAAAAHVSSTKSMTGHMLGATGAVEAMAAACSLRDGRIAPTIGLSEPDPACDLDYTPGSARDFDGRWALSTSLGFGGHNAVLALERYEEA
ncbi:MAG: beta-ketoacyl-ACP synthase II [Atopobiaceae bacterium]|jgi:3-oxoacyl-[acyl-carrier-protein] synthase II|nr:beta-ketoacyl-ACP synthase II [Atopobiaceae bacterium]